MPKHDPPVEVKIRETLLPAVKRWGPISLGVAAISSFLLPGMGWAILSIVAIYWVYMSLIALMEGSVEIISLLRVIADKSDSNSFRTATNGTSAATSQTHRIGKTCENCKNVVESSVLVCPHCNAETFY